MSALWLPPRFMVELQEHHISGDAALAHIHALLWCARNDAPLKVPVSDLAAALRPREHLEHAVAELVEAGLWTWLSDDNTWQLDLLGAVISVRRPDYEPEETPL